MSEVANRERSRRTEEEIKRTKYFSAFAVKHLEEMHILKKGGILGKEKIEGGVKDNKWRNVSEHCLVEAVIADILAEAVDASKEQRKRAVQATLLHDWYKRQEVEAMEKDGGVRGHERAAREELQLLEEYGVDENLRKLIHSNIPDSADPEYLLSRTLEEKIIHFADAILKGTIITDFHKRMDPENQSSTMIEYSESLRPRFGGKSLLEFQIQVAESEQREFEDAIGIQQGTLYDFIKTKIQERIDANSLNPNYYE